MPTRAHDITKFDMGMWPNPYLNTDQFSSVSDNFEIDDLEGLKKSEGALLRQEV